jgi:hypothetical protein
MIHLFDDLELGRGASSGAGAPLIDALGEHLRAVQASRERGDAEQVARAEEEVAADPRRALRFDSAGRATLVAAGRRYQAGRFEVLRLSELRARAARVRAAAGRPAHRRRLWVFDGSSPATDIGALQATAAPGSMFQVASQFNCLESPGAFLSPVASYFTDPTQGPRASISAFPATLHRHYAAPAAGGGRFTQQADGPQLDLLADVCDPGVAAVQNGYLRSTDIVDPLAFARVLETRFESIGVGVHDDAEVVLGADWLGGVEAAPHRTIAQVLTSTVAGGMYGDVAENSVGLVICRQLLRAAYTGTLLAAAALGKRRVVLTLIGGGVFGNPLRVIWDSILWAADEVVHALHDDLTILVNGRNLGLELPPHELRAAAVMRGGELVRFDRSGATLGD